MKGVTDSERSSMTNWTVIRKMRSLIIQGVRTNHRAALCQKRVGSVWAAMIMSISMSQRVRAEAKGMA